MIKGRYYKIKFNNDDNGKNARSEMLYSSNRIGRRFGVDMYLTHANKKRTEFAYWIYYNEPKKMRDYLMWYAGIESVIVTDIDKKVIFPDKSIVNHDDTEFGKYLNDLFDF